jgi:hypothetical protein
MLGGTLNEAFKKEDYWLVVSGYAVCIIFGLVRCFRAFASEWISDAGFSGGHSARDFRFG